MLTILSIIKLIFILIWSLFAIVVATITYVFTWSPKIPVILAKHLWSRIMLFFLGARVQVTGKENIDKGKHYVIIANHSSYADIPTLFRTLPLYLRFIGKDELRKVPFLGFYMKLSGMIFINRRNPRKARESIIEAAKIAKSGENVVIFPEGTTIEEDTIAPFKRGTTILAMEAESAILPVRIRGTHKAWPGTSNLKIRGGRIKVNIGKPIPFDQFKDKNNTELLKELRETIEAL
ncbi:MAG: 1-acyl-sn-glycerol-3-phosphate acyltransferase [Crocinitomicaceae bacterium]|nr:1-acyl-sn-glycerol-3-phosphate acyltransferase [Crocinitomicaceae bacterium]